MLGDAAAMQLLVKAAELQSKQSTSKPKRDLSLLSDSQLSLLILLVRAMEGERPSQREEMDLIIRHAASLKGHRGASVTYVISEVLRHLDAPPDTTPPSAPKENTVQSTTTAPETPPAAAIEQQSAPQKSPEFALNDMRHHVPVKHQPKADSNVLDFPTQPVRRPEERWPSWSGDLK